MRRRRRAALVLALPPLFAAAAAAAGPRLEAGEEGRWVLAGLPPIVADPGVAEHLKTGLTTSFDFRLGPRRRGGEATPTARVLVRYELWDEVFEVAAAGAGGSLERRTVGSLDELAAWWRSLRLPVAAAPRRPAGGLPVRLLIEVAPFSRAERDDAQRWFSRSLERSERSPVEELEGAAEDGSGALSQLLHLLLATSIERRPLAAYRYTLERPLEDGR